MNYFANKVVDEWGTSYSLTPAGYTVLIILMVVLLLSSCLLTRAERKFSTKQLVFSAMAMALAFVTSMLKLFHLPMGGSVTLFSMLFICLIGYWYGPRIGLTTAIAYGFLQLVSDPYIVSLPQMLTDYIFAFGALGLSGFFSKKKHGLIIGYTVGVLGRYFFAFLSGLIFFASYAEGSGMSAPIYSLAYNGAYLGAEYALTLVLLLIPAVNKALSTVKRYALDGQAQ